MVASVVGVSTTAGWVGGGTSGATFTVNTPTTEPGDLLILAIFARTGGRTIDLTPGWTLLSGDNDNPAGTITTEVQAKVATPGETAPTVHTNVADTQPSGAIIIVVRGWSGTLGNVQVSPVAFGANANPNAPTLTPTADDTLVLRIYAQHDDNTITTPPAGHTQVFAELTLQGADANMAVFSRDLPAAAGVAVGSAAVTVSGSDPWSAYTLLVPPLDGDPPVYVDIVGLLPAMTAAATGIVATAGAATAALPGLAAAAAGVAGMGASIIGLLPALTATATAQVVVRGVVDAALPAVTAGVATRIDGGPDVPSLLFPDTGTRMAVLPSGKAATNAVAYLYEDEELTTPAQAFWDHNGVAGTLIAPDVDGRTAIILDAYGRQPNYWGPVSGLDTLWIVVNGVSSRVDADYRARINAITGGVDGGIAGEAAAREAADLAVAANAAADATGKANAAQAYAVQRANHTGTQPHTTITGLGGAATLNVGTAAGTVAAGDDSRFTDGSLVAGKLDLAEYTGQGVVLAGASVGVPGALEPGADGTSLIADSGEPLGLRWQATALFGNVLAWDGSDYAPTSLKTDTSKPRIFVGPVDPAEAPGVVLNEEDWHDVWVGDA